MLVGKKSISHGTCDRVPYVTYALMEHPSKSHLCKKKSVATVSFTGAQNNKQKTIIFRRTSCRRCRKEICPPSSGIASKDIKSIFPWLSGCFNFQQNGYTAGRIYGTMRLRKIVHFCEQKMLQKVSVSCRQDKYQPRYWSVPDHGRKNKKGETSGLLLYFPFWGAAGFMNRYLFPVLAPLSHIQRPNS